MTNITIYDIEADIINDLAESHDITTAEVIEAMARCFADNNGEEEYL